MTQLNLNWPFWVRVILLLPKSRRMAWLCIWSCLVFTALMVTAIFVTNQPDGGWYAAASAIASFAVGVVLWLAIRWVDRHSRWT